MYRAPSLLRQRQDGRTAHARQDRDRFVELLLREVHQHVLHAAAFEYRVEAERELGRFTAFILIEFRICNQHRFGIKYLLHFDQSVRDQRAARRYDVEYRVGHSHGGGDFDRPFDGVYFGVDALLGEEPREDVGVGGRHALAAEVVQSVVIRRPVHGQRDAAAAESEVHGPFDREVLLRDLVQPHDPQIGDAHGHGLRNVVVAQVEHLHRESVGAGDEFALAFGDADACFREQADALLVESAFGLNCYSQHVCLLFFRHPPAERT